MGNVKERQSYLVGGRDGRVAGPGDLWEVGFPMEEVESPIKATSGDGTTDPFEETNLASR